MVFRFPGGFVISAEKCPNRLGVEGVAYWFQESPLSFERLLAEVESGEIDAVVVLGGYIKPWINPEQAELLRRAKFLALADLFPSPLSSKADLVLGMTAFAEHEGSYVNRQHRLQWLTRAIRPPLGSRSLGDLLWQWNVMTGLYKPRPYRAREILRVMAQDIPYFSAAMGEIPEHGVDLRVNQLAEHGASSEQQTT